MVHTTQTTIPLHPSVSSFLQQRHRLYYGGEWHDGYDGEFFATLNPSTGEALADVTSAQKSDVDSAVQSARQAFDHGEWRNGMSPSDREKCLWRLAELLEQHAEILGQLDALDNGKPFQTARDVDVALSAEHFRYYAGFPTKIEGSTIPINTPNMFNYTIREPIGVCGLIAPWNYPLLMAVWKLAPALAAGNCVILKPAEQTPLSALYLPYLFEEAGFPPGVFNILTGFGQTAGAGLVDHPQVDKIGFTGSVETAKIIVQASVGNLKRVSLELGGKSPNIVFADANLERAVKGATWAIFGNNGQSCTAGSRLFVQRPIFEQFIAAMAEETQRIRVGGGMSTSNPQVGPIISHSQMDKILGYVEDGLHHGTTIDVGGNRLGGELEDGYFIEPTIVTNVQDDMKIAREEIFGPVVCAMPFDEMDEVVARANDSNFGLAAGLWTENLGIAHQMASKLQAGTIWINTWGNTEAASPFGGYKQSGHGREMGKEAIDLYSEVKSVWIRTDG